MPTVQANGIDVYYEVHGTGEPMVLIPYLAINQACYAFQVADYAKHFTCYTVDLRGAGLSSKPEGTYTTELLADDVAAFMQAAGLDRAHVAGLSLGAATGMWLAAKYPAQVKSLSLHSAWHRSDPFLRDGRRDLADHGDGARQRDRDGDPGHLPVVLHAGAVRRAPGLHRLARRLRPEPADAAGRCVPAPVAGGPDPRRRAVLGSIQAPTLVTFGRHDLVTSTRFAAPLTEGIANSDLIVFDDCSHAPIYENVEEFNERTLEFLHRHSGSVQRPYS